MIEQTPDGSIVVTGAEDIHLTRILTLASGLALEINTGLRMSRHFSPLQAARNCGLVPDDGTKPRSKKLLALTIAELRRLRPDYEPNSTVAKAMEKVGLK